MRPESIRLGTRGSALALVQARQVKAQLVATHELANEQCEIVVITTTGDKITDQPLLEVGGKGLFTKELDDALIRGDIDISVHSMKDVPALLSEGLTIGAMLSREDPRDAFISVKYSSIDELPQAAVVGTSSPRRQAQALRRRPDLRTVEFRGNVETRLRKLKEGAADATILACAGLNRLGLSQHITTRVSIDVMLPAVAQGAVGIEIRVDDAITAALVAPLNDSVTALCVVAERAFLARLEGSCRTPIAGYAQLRNDALHIRGELLAPDGSKWHVATRNGSPQTAMRLGEETAAEVLARAGPGFLSALA
jgi:hydroxymethylbilane synthase